MTADGLRFGRLQARLHHWSSGAYAFHTPPSTGRPASNPRPLDLAAAVTSGILFGLRHAKPQEANHPDDVDRRGIAHIAANNGVSVSEPCFATNHSVSRVARLMALAIRLVGLIPDGVVAHHTKYAR